MIIANRLVAFHLQSLPGQKIFRNQHIPSYAFQTIQKSLSPFNYKLDILNKHPLTDLNRILSESVIRGEENLVKREIKRFLTNAYYSHTSNGHEALGTKWYTHWTSPLRRYMDILVHRLLTNNEKHIDDLFYQCQYASAIERLNKIRYDQKLLAFKSNLILKVLDQPLTAILIQKNQYQALFSLVKFDILLLARINQFNGNTIELTQDVPAGGQNLILTINKFNTIKRDLMVSFSILSSEVLNLQNLNSTFQAKFLLNQEN